MPIKKNQKKNIFNTISFKFLVIPILLLLIAGGIFWGRGYVKSIYDSLVSEELLEALLDVPIAREIAQEVTTPEPLKTDRNAPDPYLTREGSIKWTNTMRAQHGVGQLTESTLLNQSAQKKLEDMFDQQYFAHDNPQGVKPADVVSSVGYEYIMTGENLALGNFADDQDLIQAWMDSPGHRENMLKAGYTEIGIAVGQGIYEGRKTWMAVQHFGKPRSACPVIDGGLKVQLDQKSAQADAIQADLDRRKQELENNKNPQSQQEADEYNRKVDEYNAKVREFNTLVENMKQLSSQYNSQVQAYNECAKV